MRALATEAVPGGGGGPAGTGPAASPGFWSTRDWLFGLLLVLATLIAYQPAWHGKLVWDDDAHITRPELRSLTGLARIWIEPGATQQYYPLAFSAFWVQHELWGDSTLICSLDMISWCSLILGSSLSPTRAWERFSLRGSTEASVASRSGTAQREAAGKTRLRRARCPLRFCPHLLTAFLSISCFSCAGKNLRPPPLRKGRSAACASSCNPRTALGQSVAQPEPRTPGAPNSNGCQSGGHARQLV
jgi:hypothetical protein